MLDRIVAVVFPAFAIILGGWLYGRRHSPDMAVANRLNTDVFLPSLIFAAMVDRSFDLKANSALAWGALVTLIGCGLIAWGVSKVMKVDPRTFVPPVMFNNAGNLGIPLSVLAFGDQALGPAVVMLMVSNLMHFSFGVWLLDHHAKWWTLWRLPMVLCTMAGLAISLSGTAVWPPLKTAFKMVGDVSVPLMLFALGARVADSPLSSWRVSLVGAAVRPAAGLALTWTFATLMGLHGMQRAILLLFGALPPAILNYVLAERYHQEPATVASTVLIGNIAGAVIIPLILALTLT